MRGVPSAFFAKGEVIAMELDLIYFVLVEVRRILHLAIILIVLL